MSKSITIRKLVAVAICFVSIVTVGANSQAMQNPTSWNGVKVSAKFKGDCVQPDGKVLVTNLTTACTIEVAVTPKKVYKFVSLIKPLPIPKGSFQFWNESGRDVYYKTNAKGVVSIPLSTFFACIDGEYTYYRGSVFLEVTVTRYTYANTNPLLDRARSKRLPVTFGIDSQTSIDSSPCEFVSS